MQDVSQSNHYNYDIMTEIKLQHFGFNIQTTYICK